MALEILRAVLYMAIIWGVNQMVQGSDKRRNMKNPYNFIQADTARQDTTKTKLYYANESRTHVRVKKRK